MTPRAAPRCGPPGSRCPAGCRARRCWSRLATAQAYLHTAAWEAAPVSILEAAAVGLPVLARGIATLESLAVPGLGATPTDLADGLAALHDPAAWATARAASQQFSAASTAADQRAALEAAYGRSPAGLIRS
ncbi:hypothetical protein [Nocardioides convexus]|uniref:hypothetical protein n=1 Tax=Nocardioides convexus TaxID=2712224 RepID=UPI00241826BF|nr:hypothetical protein [Nocardioides convexus]